MAGVSEGGRWRPQMGEGRGTETGSRKAPWARKGVKNLCQENIKNISVPFFFFFDSEMCLLSSIICNTQNSFLTRKWVEHTRINSLIHKTHPG